MEISNENELIKIIKDKSLEEIKSYFQEYQITPTKFNYFNNVLIYFIKNKGSFEIIEFFIKQQQKENYHFLINNAEALFCSIEYSNFEIANLLLKYGVKITNKNAKSENIIEYLIRVDRRLYEKKLSFILKIKNDLSLLTDKVLFELFGNYNYESCIETILNFKFITNKESIINTLIIAKKRIPMTDKELQKYVFNNLKPPVINFNIKNEEGNTLFLHHIIHTYSELYKKIISYSKENNIILNLNEQNNEGFNSLLYETYYGNIYNVEYFEFLINYAKKNKIVLEMNKKNKYGNNAIFNLIKRGYERYYFTSENSTEYRLIELLFDYAKETNYIIDLNEKDNEGNFPLLYITHKTDCIYNKIKKKLVQLIIEYAFEFNIILELCEKNDTGEFTILKIFNDYDMLILLFEYAEKLNIISDIFKYANILLYNAISNNDSNIIRLIIETAQNNNIIIDFGKYESSILHDSINCNGNEIFLLIMNYVKNNNIKLKLNEEDKYGNYPLLMAIQRKSIEKVQFLMEYAHDNNIVLELNKQNSNGLLAAIDYHDNCVKIVQLLINYAKENNIILKINAIGGSGNNPLLKAIYYSNVEILQLLEDYAKEHNIVLEIKNNEGNSPLFGRSRNTKVLQWLIHYAKENNIILDLNEKNNDGDYPLLKLYGNDECLNILVKYAKENNIILYLNEKNSKGDYPLLNMVGYGECLSILFKYAKKNNITLTINDKNNNGEYPLLTGIENYKFVKLLINYANENNILLDMNSSDKKGYNPLIKILEFFKYKKNKEKIEKVKVIQLIMNYAYKNNITLNIEEKMIINGKRSKSIFELAVESSNIEIFNLFIEYAQHHGILLSLFKNNYSDDLTKSCNLLLYALFYCNNSYIIKLIVEIAKKNNIKYNLFNGYCYTLICGIELKDVEIIEIIIQNAEKNNVIITDHDLNRSLLEISKINDNISEKIVKLIINYAKEIDTILTVDHASKFSPFANAVHRNNFNVVQLIIDYAKENNITIDINKINHYTNYPLFHNKNIAMTKLLMEYARENKMVIDINLKNYHEKCSLSCQIKKDNIEMVQLLMQYANENNIILDLNSADKDGNYPFLRATRKCKETMVKLLLDYANENNIIIDINRKNNQGNFPLLLAIRGNSVEVVQLLIDYAKTHHITLDVDQLEFYNRHFVVNPDDKDKIKYNTKEITEIILEYKKNYII